MILSNELPRFGDASGAISSRFIVLTMQESFLGREDIGLDRRLNAELPAILKWALAGLVRLQRQGRITVPARSHDAIEALADLVSPISAFVREVCELGRGSDTTDYLATQHELYTQWGTWCEDNGHYTSSKQKFSSDLRSILPGRPSTSPRVDSAHCAGSALAPSGSRSNAESGPSGHKLAGWTKGTVTDHGTATFAAGTAA